MKVIDEKDFQSVIKKCIQNVEDICKKSVKKKTFFAITSTGKKTNRNKPYAMPNRIFRFFNFAGCVVFSQEQAHLVAQAIDGKVGYILVDVEKKIPLGGEQCIIDGLHHEGHSKTLGNIASANISGEVTQTVKKSKLQYFKANDITVDSIWLFLESKLNDFSGKKIAIVGSGNIGSKLALKLVESGCNVSIYRRDVYKGNAIAHAINLIKPESTISQVEYVDSIVKACFMADVVIGCTNGIEAVDVNSIKGTKKAVICVDAGKGSFSKNVSAYLEKKKISMYRTDISACLEGYISSVLRNEDILSSSCGRAYYKGYKIVSGGLLGAEDEIVVDDYRCPKLVFGIANGQGDFKQDLSMRDKKKLELLKKIICGC